MKAPGDEVARQPPPLREVTLASLLPLARALALNRKVKAMMVQPGLPSALGLPLTPWAPQGRRAPRRMLWDPEVGVALAFCDAPDRVVDRYSMWLLPLDAWAPHLARLALWGLGYEARAAQVWTAPGPWVRLTFWMGRFGPAKSACWSSCGHHDGLNLRPGEGCDDVPSLPSLRGCLEGAQVDDCPTEEREGRLAVALCNAMDADGVFGQRMPEAQVINA